MHSTTNHPHSLVFQPGAADTSVRVSGAGIIVECAMPWLAGPTRQTLGTGMLARQQDDGYTLESDTGICGVLVAELGSDLAATTGGLYARLFALTRGMPIQRIWNFVPRINRIENGVENYLAFNAGRHRAFVGEFGRIPPAGPPAASALGVHGRHLALAFTAGISPVRNFENPLQIPASHYPERYGKNPPLFTRGSVIPTPRGTIAHLSGTSSVRDSESVGGTFAEQLDVTLANIDIMLANMAVDPAASGDWKVFLRHPEDLPECRAAMQARYPASIGHTIFLHADICRADLLLEVEAAFFTSSDSTREGFSRSFAHQS